MGTLLSPMIPSRPLLQKCLSAARRGLFSTHIHPFSNAQTATRPITDDQVMTSASMKSLDPEVHDLIEAETVRDIAREVNMSVLFDATSSEVRLSSNAMSTRGCEEKDFVTMISQLKAVHGIALSVKQKGREQCVDDIAALKTEICEFARQFPLVGVDQ